MDSNIFQPLHPAIDMPLPELPDRSFIVHTRELTTTELADKADESKTKED